MQNKNILVELSKDTFIKDDINKTEFFNKLENISSYLSTLKSFPNEEEKEYLKNFLNFIPKVKIILSEELIGDYLFNSNLISIFVDFMKIMAPQLELNDEILKFYFKIFVRWLEFFSVSNNIDMNCEFQQIFDCILERLAKTNLLSLMINVSMENEISIVISTIITIQGYKRYSQKNKEFQNFILIIKGLLEEVRTLNIPLLNDILLNMNKKKVNLEQFNLSLQILSEMKNILSAPINQLIFQLTTVDKKDKKASEILKINGEEFCNLLKKLCTISNEYLINFLSTLPTNETLNKLKLRASLKEIYLSIFSTNNSIFIARDYSQIFKNFLESFSSKLTKENEKIKIFLCLLKFLYRNNKIEMKNYNLYSILLDKIKLYFEELKNESTAKIILDAISKKIYKNKKIPVKIIKYVQCFLDSKNIKLSKYTLEFNNTILNKMIIRSTSLFDLFSLDKKKRIEKFSFLYNNLINRMINNTQLKNEFNDNMFDMLLEKKAETLIILFYMTMNDFKANGSLHKYCSESVELSLLILGICNIDNNNIILSPERDNQRRYKIFKNKLESNIMTILEDNGNLRNEIKNILYPDENNSILNKIIENFPELKKFFIIFFNNNEIKLITEFGALIINTYDEWNDKNYELLQSLLSVLLYYVKFNVSIILIHNDFNTDYYLTNNFNLKAVFQEIFDFLRKILNLKIVNKHIMNYITAIIKNLNSLKSDLINENITSLIFTELSKFCFQNYDQCIKSLAFLYYEINKSNNKLLLPKELDEYMFVNDRKLILSPIKFINEILKQYHQYNLNLSTYERLIDENFKSYILNDINEYCENTYNHQLTNLKNKKINSNSLSELKRDVINLLLLKHEILKYEFYVYIYEKNQVNHKSFIKKIFTDIYLLCNKEGEINELEKINTLTEDINFQKLKLIRSINNLNICKYINLIFRHFENGVGLKPSHQVKLMNLALNNEIFVRNHLLKKLEKSLNENVIQHQLHAIPIICIYFNDIDKALKRKANDLFASFINYLLNRYNLHKENDKYKNKNSLYKYLPEVYITYLITYFVFNSNLNLIYQSKEKKNFEIIVTAFLKIIKKVTNNNYDSNFIIQNCIKIKNQSLKDKKVIKKLSKETYLKELIKVDDSCITWENYEYVKNEICNFIIKIINSEFSTNFKHLEVKPYIPLIFTNEKMDTSFGLSIIKYNNEESNFSNAITNSNKNITKTNRHTLQIEPVFEESNFNNVISDVTTRTNDAVLNHTLDSINKSKKKENISDQSEQTGYDFANTSFYSKYKVSLDDETSELCNLELIQDNFDFPLKSKKKESIDINSDNNIRDSKRKNSDNLKNEQMYKKKKK